MVSKNVSTWLFFISNLAVIQLHKTLSTGCSKIRKNVKRNNVKSFFSHGHILLFPKTILAFQNSSLRVLSHCLPDFQIHFSVNYWLKDCVWFISNCYVQNSFQSTSQKIGNQSCLTCILFFFVFLVSLFWSGSSYLLLKLVPKLLVFSFVTTTALLVFISITCNLPSSYLKFSGSLKMPYSSSSLELYL